MSAAPIINLFQPRWSVETDLLKLLRPGVTNISARDGVENIDFEVRQHGETEARSGMFSFATGTGACLASFDFARGLLARSNGESFAPLFWRRCQCELSVLLLLDGLPAYKFQKEVLFQVLFKLRGERREPYPTQSAFQTLGIPGNVFGRRSTVLLQREVFVDFNDEGQAPESVLFLLFGQKRFMETFPPPSILRFRFGFGFTGFRSRLFTHFSWHVDFRYDPTPQERKVFSARR